MHLALDIVGLVASLVALSFTLVARGSNNLKSRNRAVFLLSLDIGIEVIEDLVRWWVGIMFSPEGVALEALTLALTVMALYYMVSGKYLREKTPFNIASWCMGWVVMGEFLEFVMGLIMGE
jgi:hypothetical protein